MESYYEFSKMVNAKVMMESARALLDCPPDAAARRLLGCTLLVRDAPSGQWAGGRIVETEAYFGAGDAAAHRARGETPATRSLFLATGTLYVHRNRHHHLVDIVVQHEACPGSVLLRALEPAAGLALMASRRGTEKVEALASGPGKLCAALGIDKRLDGADVFLDERLRLEIGAALGDDQIAASRRIGISRNAEPLWRFTAKGSRFVSRR